MINGLFGVRFLFSGTKMERCSIDDYSSILQRPLVYLLQKRKIPVSGQSKQMRCELEINQQGNGVDDRGDKGTRHDSWVKAQTGCE